MTRDEELEERARLLRETEAELKDKLDHLKQEAGVCKEFAENWWPDVGNVGLGMTPYVLQSLLVLVDRLNDRITELENK
jgi:hypothetical protein